MSATDSDQTDKLGTRSLFFQDTLHLTDRFALVGGVRYMEYEQLAGRGRPFKANTDLSGDKALPLGAPSSSSPTRSPSTPAIRSR